MIDKKISRKNFFIKIQKMETILNLWLKIDLTLFRGTMLAKSLGISQLTYVVVQFYPWFKFVSNSLSYITILKNKRYKI